MNSCNAFQEFDGIDSNLVICCLKSFKIEQKSLKFIKFDQTRLYFH